jgi:hypothetical protein
VTRDELLKRFPNASPAFLRNNASDCPVVRQSPAPVVERDLWNGPLAAGKAQGNDSGKFLVRVTSFRRRLLDEDNLCEKYVVDCCRYAGLIPGDAPGTTKIETSQQKVSSKEEERTEVTIERMK